jgi:hypothetical protein
MIINNTKKITKSNLNNLEKVLDSKKKGKKNKVFSNPLINIWSLMKQEPANACPPPWATRGARKVLGRTFFSLA